jgi:cytidine/deoxycytidylate deaminase-like protein
MDPFLLAAIEEAERGLSEGGIPIGSVLVHSGAILGRGHNRRVQRGSTILHAEMDALESPSWARSSGSRTTASRSTWRKTPAASTSCVISYSATPPSGSRTSGSNGPYPRIRSPRLLTAIVGRTSGTRWRGDVRTEGAPLGLVESAEIWRYSVSQMSSSAAIVASRSDKRPPVARAPGGRVVDGRRDRRPRRGWRSTGASDKGVVEGSQHGPRARRRRPSSRPRVEEDLERCGDRASHFVANGERVAYTVKRA